MFGGAFDLNRAKAIPAPAAGEPPPPPTANPVEGTGDAVSSQAGARVFALFLVVVGVGLALVLKEKTVGFVPREGFGIFAGFYIAAQAIERLLELLPAGLGSKQAKANRAVIFPALGFILAVFLAEKLGLFYVDAIGSNDLSKDWDVIITALAIGGGTKPLHDAIKSLEKVKEGTTT